MGGKSSNKAGYFDKLKELLEDHKSVFIVTVDSMPAQSSQNTMAYMLAEY